MISHEAAKKILHGAETPPRPRIGPFLSGGSPTMDRAAAELPAVLRTLRRRRMMEFFKKKYPQIWR